MAAQSPKYFPGSGPFPITHDISIDLPPNLVTLDASSLKEWYGIVETMTLDYSMLKNRFYRMSDVVDWLEDNIEGRVVIYEDMASRFICFSRRGQCLRFRQWISQRNQDHHQPVTIASPDRMEEVEAWIDEHRSKGAIHLGGYPIGLTANYPNGVWIEDKDVAFAFRMKFGGEPTEESS